jgi:hypothetical protein
MIDIHFFRHDYIRNLDNPRLGIDFKKINFPTAEDFTLADFSLSGYPQTSLASKEVFFIYMNKNYSFSIYKFF